MHNTIRPTLDLIQFVGSFGLDYCTLEQCVPVVLLTLRSALVHSQYTYCFLGRAQKEITFAYEKITKFADRQKSNRNKRICFKARKTHTNSKSPTVYIRLVPDLKTQSKWYDVEKYTAEDTVNRMKNERKTPEKQKTKIYKTITRA